MSRCDQFRAVGVKYLQLMQWVKRVSPAGVKGTGAPVGVKQTGRV